MTYYSFLIDDHKVGYFEMDFQQNIIYQNARMTIDGTSFDNPFWLKIGDDQRILAFKYDAGSWHDLSSYPDHAYPTCAFLFLVRRIAEGESLEYSAINEGKNLVTGKAVITRQGQTITETVNGTAGRYVKLGDSSSIMEIGWGGSARCLLMENRAMAVAETAFE